MKDSEGGNNSSHGQKMVKKVFNPPTSVIQIQNLDDVRILDLKKKFLNRRSFTDSEPTEVWVVYLSLI
jgi:hypothetical protein